MARARVAAGPGQDRYDVLEQSARDARAEPTVREGLGLDQDVVMSDCSPFSKDRDAARHDLLVPGRVSVKEREESRRVDECHACSAR